MSPQPIAVLVVEDEPLLRMDIVAALVGEGFTVFEAGNASEAITILSINPDIHALFTDIDMPGSVDGLKLAAFVKDRWPPVEIIVTSGKWKLAAEELPLGAIFVPKPYEHAQVIRSIRALLKAA